MLPFPRNGGREKLLLIKKKSKKPQKISRLAADPLPKGRAHERGQHRERALHAAHGLHLLGGLDSKVLRQRLRLAHPDGVRQQRLEPGQFRTGFFPGGKQLGSVVRPVRG